ncbi:MAG: PilN domain-containing protein [Nitrospirae bacterium]|nr:PilN domain-containing protein [Nitrospirota bacterium]
MIRINLLPYRDVKRKAEVRRVVVVLLASLLGVGFASVLMETWVVVRSSEVQAQIRTEEQEEERLAGIRREVQQFKVVEADLRTRLDVLEHLRSSRRGPAHFLDDLAASAPERLWVLEFQETVSEPAPAPPPADSKGKRKKDVDRDEGTAPAPPPPAVDPLRSFRVRGRTTDYRSIAEFMINLRKTPSFENVELEEVQEQAQGPQGRFLEFALKGVIVSEKSG